MGTTWETALANFDRAYAGHEAAWRNLDRAQAPYFEAREQVEPNARQRIDPELRHRFGVDVAETETSRACAAVTVALDAVLSTPAPNLAAVIRKIELAAEYEREAGDLGAVLDDLRRMAGVHEGDIATVAESMQ